MVGEKRVDLVLEGGGVKGIALAGALAVLEKEGFEAQNIAGASAGAIVAALHAAGYTAAELRGIISKLDYDRFKDRAWEDRVPLVGRYLSILMHRGIYEGKEFLGFMDGLLRERNVRTFGDLIRDADEEEARYRYKLQVIVSDVTGRRLLVLPRDAVKLGVEAPDDFSVAEAVRMSMSIPIFFEPVKFHNPQTGREHLLVDGGMLSNFPVWLFDSEGVPEWPTFGLRLREPEPRTATLADRLPEPDSRESEGITDYLKSLVATMLEAHDRLHIEKADYARTIAIPTLGVRTTDFGLSSERALELYESGRAAAEEFLKTWSFEDYINEFRRGEETAGEASSG